MITNSKTDRGFNYSEFKDRYGHTCSIQMSSLATIWFGVNDADPKIMASDATRLGIPTTETCGWVPYPVPKEVAMYTRMHLSREDVAQIIPVLQRFVDTGNIAEESEEYLDDDGYPTDVALEKIKNWPHGGWHDLMQFCADLWYYPDRFVFEVGVVKVSTGGWSGNESIIGALKENTLFWTLCWSKSVRGGYYEFTLP